jgi:membrane protein
VARALNFPELVKGVWRRIWPVVKQAATEWSSDNAPRLGAALSYYTIFSIAPVLIVVIAVAGMFLGAQAAQGEIARQLGTMIGPEAAKTIQDAVAKASAHRSGTIASIIGIATLLVGASGVMLELQGALNTVWKVLPKPGANITRFLRARVLALGLVLSFGFILLVSMVASAGLEVLSKWMGGYLPGWVILGYALNYGVSIAVVAAFFALLFKVLPDATVAWKDVWVGAFITSVLFHLGKYGIALYIGRASVASTFGAAGSLAVLLVWIYYSSQILLFGAELTRAYADRYGSRVRPDENAVEAPHAAAERLAAEKAQKLDVPPSEALAQARGEPPPPKERKPLGKAIPIALAIVAGWQLFKRPKSR